MKRILFPILLAAALVLTAVAWGGGGAALTIRHQVRGCHTWSVNGGPFKAAQSVTLHRGDTVTVTNDDIMPHKLVQTAGPKLRLPSASMHRVGASIHVVFSKTGVYRFTTKAGEDYPSMGNMKTVGEDNVLKLTVKVV